MSEPSDLRISAQSVLEAYPYMGMILNSKHHVVLANTWFARATETPPGQCPLACYEAVHHTDAPPEECPLTESARTGRPASAIIHDEKLGALKVDVYPLQEVDEEGNMLFLHFAYPV